jgi:hypothetical protein
MRSSSCELDRHIVMRSSCCHHCVISTDTHAHRHAIITIAIIVWFRQTNAHRHTTNAFSFHTTSTQCVGTNQKMMIARRSRLQDDSMAMCQSNSQDDDSNMTFPHWVSTIVSPNDDFGRIDKRGNPDFRSTFQWFVYQIEYSRPWKMLRQSA